MTAHAAEQCAAERTGSRSLSGIAGDPADNGTLGSPFHQILCHGGFRSGTPIHAAEQGTTHSTGRSPLTGIAGDPADNRPLDGPTGRVSEKLFISFDPTNDAKYDDQRNPSDCCDSLHDMTSKF
jgi:hypothetical protein